MSDKCDCSDCKDHQDPCDYTGYCFEMTEHYCEGCRESAQERDEWEFESKNAMGYL